MAIIDFWHLVDEMTPEEQGSQLAGEGCWRTTGIERLEIPSIKVTDGSSRRRRRGDRLTSKSWP
jgi:beta-glucosidase